MKKFTRRIEVVEYELVLFDSENETITKEVYTDYESSKEADIVRYLNSRFSDTGDSRRVVKITPVHASCEVYEMPITTFLKYATVARGGREN